MTKNPFINALAATLYITAVATLIFNAKKLFGPGPDTLLVPIAMISLITLSAAIMGYLFLYQPLLLLLDGYKKNAVNIFLQTLAIFAGITILLFIMLSLHIFK